MPAECQMTKVKTVTEKGKQIRKEMRICGMAAQPESIYCPRHTYLHNLEVQQNGVKEVRKLAADEAGVGGKMPMNRKALEFAGYDFLDGEDCKGCRRPIEFWKTPKGKRAPFDPMPQPYSTVTSHFATCTHVEQFRKAS